MSQAPSDDGDDDMERRFQTGLEKDGGPSDAVRRAILEHAHRMAAEHARSQPRGRRSAMLIARRRNTIFGTLAAAVFAGLLVLPILRTPFLPKQNAGDLPPTSAALSTPVPAPAPQPEVVGRSETAERSETTESAAGAQSQEPARPAANSFKYASQAKSAASATAGAAAAPPAAPAPPPATQPAAAAGARASAADAVAEISAVPASATRNLARAANSPAERGESLRGAAAAGDVAAVKALLGSAPDVDARDRSGRTALMLAIVNGHAVVVDALLAHGADVNAVDVTGVRPLQMARAAGNREIVDSLLRAGAR
jgi:hypothetical protein